MTVRGDARTSGDGLGRLVTAMVAGTVAVATIVLSSASASATSPPTWTTTAVPPVAGTTPTLNGVDCAGAGSCVAVGTSGGHALVDTLSDGTWTAATGIDPADATSVSLAGVSCPSAASCVAVGAASSGGEEPLIETLDSGTWTPLVPSEPSGTADVQLTGVSCPSSTWCVAVGWGKGTGGPQGVAYVLSGGNWTSSVLAAQSTSELFGVSCPAAGSCEAVGTSTFAPPTIAEQTVSLLVDSLAAGSWSSTTLNAMQDTIFTQELDAVSCAGVGSCVAVGRGGNVVDNNGGTSSDSEWTLADGSWTENATFIGAAVNYGFLDTSPPGVSCPSTAMCMAAAATNLPGPSTIVAIAEELSGSTWTLDLGPNPAKTGGALTAVSCATPTWCAAIGAIGGPVVSIYGSTPSTQAPVGAVGGLVLAVVIGIAAYVRFRRIRARTA